MKRLGFIICLCISLLAMMFRAGWASTFTEGFEGLPSSYNFYADPGSSAGISNTVAHSGSQSAQFTLDATHFAYTRWKSGDLTSYGIKLSDLEASDWVERTLGRSDLSPYFLFTVATPDVSQETLAIQFSMAPISDNVWTQNIINRSSTTFHVVGDRTGLGATEFSASGTQGTLDDLSAKTYSGSTTWGDFSVTYVRVGVGLWDASQEYNGFADDVTVSGAPAVPEPATMLLLGSGLLSLVGLKRKFKK